MPDNISIYQKHLVAFVSLGCGVWSFWLKWISINYRPQFYYSLWLATRTFSANQKPFKKRSFADTDLTMAFLCFGVLTCVMYIMTDYNGVIMSAMVPQIYSLTIVYQGVYSGADQRKHQSPASLAFWGEFTGDRWIPAHKGLITRRMFPFDDIIMW